MKVEVAFTDAIEVGDRHRKLDKNRVKQIAESMKAIGLQHPIHIYQPSTSGTEPIHLVAGRHRLAAALELGMAHPASVRTGSLKCKRPPGAGRDLVLEDDRALDHSGPIRYEPRSHDIHIQSAAVHLDAHVLSNPQPVTREARS